ncbi:MAG TPA: hypothetical protein VGC42_05340 [Kofleriaceae bacterium]
MRHELPDVIARAIAGAARPSLVFELARIDDNLRQFADAARAAGVTALFAAKSFPHPAVRALAAQRFAGFDVASAAEVRDAIAAGAGVLSVADPSARAIAAVADWRGRLIASCETAAQVAAAPPGAEIAIRISASIARRDPAVGAVLDGSGHRRSRFGLDIEPARLRAALGELARAAGDRPVGLHVHHGPVSATSADRFALTARAVLDAARDAGLAPRFLDLGGAWHAIGDLAACLAQLRAAVPELELLAEPGRRIADGAGYATGRVAVSRALDDRQLCVVELSRICHLRWSQPELVAAPPRTGLGVPTLVAGPTCYEDDVLGEWTVEADALAAGRRAVFRNVTGYAIGWNTGFAGIPPADVVVT